MNWRELIRHWPQWPGWRTYAPALGSVVVHGLVITAAAGMMATAMPERARPDQQRFLAVQLVEPEMPPPEAGVTPPPVKRPDVAPSKSPAIAPSSVTPRPAGPSTTTPSPTPDKSKDDGNSFYIGPPVTKDAPPGLASLMSNDPCTAKFGPKAKECAGRDLARKTGPMDSLLPTTKEEQAKNYAAFMEKCPHWVGCEGGEWRSTSGARSVYGTRGAGGAASLGGIHDLVGRLPQKPDFVDRGFGD